MKALVTGASGGIGLEICRILASEGYDLAIAARNGEALQKVADELTDAHGVKVDCFPCDLTSDDAASRLCRDVGDVDVLVNNAGFGDYGRFLESDLGKQDDMIRLNVTALTDLTHMFAKGMVERGNGKILNIASVASFEAGPLMSVYYATKAYVLSFSEALATELKGTGVTVTAVCPGPVGTGFARTAGADVATMFKDGKVADPRSVAAFAVKKMMKGKVVAVHGAGYKVLTVLVKFLPRCVTRRAMLWIQGRRA
ncbi:MAG: SDR family oxidoreductase [archaeon]|nr:SDR family oxidoreductase [archaeon]